MISLESAQARIDRAGEHYKALDAEIRRFAEHPANTITDEANPDQTQYLSRIRWGEPPDLQRYGVLLGDCIHSLRCALDHTVYAMAVANAGVEPPPAHKRLMFPIKATAQGFKGGGANRIETLKVQQQAIIEGLQPYQAPQAADPPRLLILDELDVTEKHRSVPVAMTVLTNAEPRFKRTPGVGAQVGVIPLALGQPLEDGTPLYAVTFSKPTEVVEMYHDISYAVCIEYRPDDCLFDLFGILEELFAVVQKTIYDMTGEHLVVPLAWDGTPMGRPVPPEDAHDASPS